MSFLHHLQQEDSAFIKAIKTGKWVLMDGIESAPRELFEKICSLCSREPFLDLFEKGPNFYYSRTVEGENRIHDDFHLFLTYNSVDVEPHRRLSPSVLNRFATFVLQPIDVSASMSAVVLHGILQSQHIQRDLGALAGARLGQVHVAAKAYASEHSAEFATGIKFTGRNLVFSSRIFGIQSNGTIGRPGVALASAIFFTYCNPSKHSAAFYSRLLAVFSKSPSAEVFQCIERSRVEVDEDYAEILQPLRRLQLQWEKSGFDFPVFCRNVGLFWLRDIARLHFHLEDTLSMLYGKNNDPLNGRYGCLRILSNVVNLLNEAARKVKSQFLTMDIQNDRLRAPQCDNPRAQYFLLFKLLEANLVSLSVPSLFRCPLFFQKANDFKIEKSFQSCLEWICTALSQKEFLADARAFLCSNFLQGTEQEKVINWISFLFTVAGCPVGLTLNSDVITDCDVGCPLSMSLVFGADWSLTEETEVTVDGQLVNMSLRREAFIDWVGRILLTKKYISTPIRSVSAIRNTTPLMALFPSDATLVSACIATCYAVPAEERKLLSLVLDGFERQVLAMISRIISRLMVIDLAPAMEFLRQFDALVTGHPHLLQLVSSSQKEFIESQKDNVEAINDEVERLRPIMNEMKMKEFHYIKSSKVETYSTAQWFEAWCDQLTQAHDELAAVKLAGRERQELRQVQQDIAALQRELREGINAIGKHRVLSELSSQLVNMTPTQANVKQARSNIQRAIQVLSSMKKQSLISYPDPLRGLGSGSFTGNKHQKL
jgi:hypothetical protein